VRAKLLVTLILVSLWVLALAGPAGAQAKTVTTVEQIPINFVTDGCEEPIELSGTLHLVSHVTVDAAGGFHFVSQTNPQGVTGRGLISGTVYRGTGVGRFNENVTAGGTVEFTGVGSFKIIGRGPTDNLLVQAVFHVTVNPAGTVTTEVDQFFVKCQG
jgi:hypothetical protein